MPTRYFYFFRGTLSTHVHFYKGWVDAARERNIPIHMVTMMPEETYREQIALVKQFRKFDYFHILRYKTNAGKQLLINLFFGWHLLWNRKVVVQLKKQDISQFDTLKQRFPNRLKCIIELEGDVQSEVEYLLEHPYKPEFYKHLIHSVKKGIERIPQVLEKTDHVLVLSDYFKDTLCERYPHLRLDAKTSAISTGVDCSINYFSQELRDRARQELGVTDRFVMTFIGNVYYSWQNLSRTVELFGLIKQTVAPKSFLMLLILEQDHPIALEFLEKYRISSEDYLLRQVPYDQVAYHLNAADMAFLLRTKHPMNRAASPGKFGDYVACGVPVIMTDEISDYSQMIAQTGHCVVLDDMNDDDEVLRKIMPFLNYDPDRRQRLAQWAKDHVSIDKRLDTYVDALVKI